MVIWRGNGIFVERDRGAVEQGLRALVEGKKTMPSASEKEEKARSERQDLGSRRAGQVRILGGRGAGTDLLKKVKA